jgi:hypothetical protein
MVYNSKMSQTGTDVALGTMRYASLGILLVSAFSAIMLSYHVTHDFNVPQEVLLPHDTPEIAKRILYVTPEGWLSVMLGTYAISAGVAIAQEKLEQHYKRV